MYTKNSQSNKKEIVAIDFFCGCGGVTSGMKKAGINVLAGFDNDLGVSYAYEENNKPAKFIQADIEQKEDNIFKINDILKGIKHDILIFMACAPCQPFSLHNRKYEEDSRKSLMIKFVDIINELSSKNKPNVIFMENVGPMKKRGQEVLNKVLERLRGLNYGILLPRVVDAAEYGVPQRRKRLIFVAIENNRIKNKDKFNWEYFENKYKDSPVDVKMAIGTLPSIPHCYKINREDPLHVSRDLSPLNLKRIRQINKPGSGREMWDRKYLLRCYKKHDGHKDVYGRMSWNKPAPTLTCKCTSISNGRFGHPEQHRAISLREAAILQTMDTYRFQEPIIATKVARQIGNAVPPKLAQKFGQFILELV